MTKSEITNRVRSLRHGVLALVAGCAFAITTLAATPDFIIETPNNQFNYRVNGVDNNPTITLLRGRTYTFLVTNTWSLHPVVMRSSVFGSALPGVTGDNTSSGTITYSVPANATGGVYYCGFHGFSGTIQVVDPPAPTIRIVDLQVTTNLTVTATLAATNGLTLIPEFNTNAGPGNWFALTVQTNRFANGTNEAVCGKPPGNAVLIRLRAQSQ